MEAHILVKMKFYSIVFSKNQVLFNCFYRGYKKAEVKTIEEVDKQQFKGKCCSLYDTFC